MGQIAPMDSVPSTPKHGRMQFLLVCAGLIMAVIAIYWPVHGFDHIHWDDPGYVYDNPMVTKGLTIEGVRWAFTSGYAANWHPLTWLSHMLDVQLFGLNTGAHHMMNVFFHALNALLVLAVFYRYTGKLWTSALVAALFAVHPLRVESVAWISERKDVLSTAFWLLTMLAYGEYARKPGILRYVSVLVLFALGLMAKPMLVTLPCVLLLMDLWPLKRMEWFRGWRTIGLRVLEKVPLFALAALCAVLTLWAQEGYGTVQSTAAFPVFVRIQNAVAAYGAYLWMMIWPVDLAVIYPHSGDTLPAWLVALAVFALGVLTATAFATVRKQPFFLAGWLWYLGTLVPVIGLVQVGIQSMADRYTYVPQIGIYLILAWLVSEGMEQFPRLRKGVIPAVVVVLLLLSVQARRQVNYWENTITLFNHALDATGPNYVAYLNLGAAYMDRDEFGEAESHFVAAHRADPTRYEPLFNLGQMRRRQGKPKEAAALLEEALRRKPDHLKSLQALGGLLLELNKPGLAKYYLEQALALEPGDAAGWVNLGIARAQTGETKASLEAFERAVVAAPHAFNAVYNAGMGFLQAGELERAVELLQRAHDLEPDDPGPAAALAACYIQAGRAEDARTLIDELSQNHPSYPDIPRLKKALGELLGKKE